MLVGVPLIRKDASILSPVSLTLPADAPADWTDVFTGMTVTPGGREVPMARTGSTPAPATLSWPEGFTAFPVVLLTATG